jgi:predicted nucleotidyltransferase
MLLTREKIVEELKSKREFLAQRFHVTKIGIFGSFAKNEGTSTSDIDFLVEFDVPMDEYIKNRYALLDYLGDLFGRKVDLANPKSLKPYYKERILNQAIYA